MGDYQLNQFAPGNDEFKQSYNIIRRYHVPISNSVANPPGYIGLPSVDPGVIQWLNTNQAGNQNVYGSGSTAFASTYGRENNMSQILPSTTRTGDTAGVEDPDGINAPREYAMTNVGRKLLEVGGNNSQNISVVAPEQPLPVGQVTPPAVNSQIGGAMKNINYSEPMPADKPIEPVTNAPQPNIPTSPVAPYNHITSPLAPNNGMCPKCGHVGCHCRDTEMLAKGVIVLGVIVILFK